SVSEIGKFASHGGLFEKTSFSCWREPGFEDRFRSHGRNQALVFGMEAHVCVLQSVLEMLGAGVQVYVVADACGSRRPEDKALALSRMAARGAEVVSSEMVIFELLRVAATAEFREVLPLIK
ncbi:MAG: isochorismatase family protein, partial [Kiloniellales bacterium]|nr:isochorismatase family protein [Kiloniellales bacterium]